MEQYIPKSVLVAEINRQIELLKPFLGACAGQIVAEANSKIAAYNRVKDIINVLEVKGVDLDESARHYLLYEHVSPLNKVLHQADLKVEMQYHKDIEGAYKAGFELGIKAQHDNWKVVDNINPPQADRNKIYCVFTKQRYILAKVIDHPQDDGLLQWKCTEFPNHRYDMCEGDKYMQIV